MTHKHHDDLFKEVVGLAMFVAIIVGVFGGDVYWQVVNALFMEII